jgi:catechol 2,3-dioxygenase-like lactoylglutathione lyase family enzyme
MSMFTHVTVGTNDPESARAFYDAVFGALGIPGKHTPKGAWYGDPDPEAATGAFFVATPRDEQAATHANGGTDEGPPGERPYGEPPMYGAYMRDPDGNKLCVFCMPGT